MDVQSFPPARRSPVPFRSRRGRPKSERPRVDLGTPELQQKRALHTTDEALDLCLARGLITQEQHWCGIHFRWLYTLRYGAPGVRAVDPAHYGGRDIAMENPQWRKEREIEYRDAVEQLQKTGKVAAILQLCVFNQRPDFMNRLDFKHMPSLSEREHLLVQFQEGLDALVQLWCRKSRRRPLPPS